jgi:hypothetical protein
MAGIKDEPYAHKRVMHNIVEITRITKTASNFTQIGICLYLSDISLNDKYNLRKQVEVRVGA